MSSFTTRPDTLPASTLQLNKHVKYTLGMILGVDDLTQEFTYLSGRDQWIARDVLGYGTVWGLRVRADQRDGAPEVVVDPGVAITPRGQLVYVTPAQCARLNDWLALEQSSRELIGRIGSPPATSVRLYVVLCYRDCSTDQIPIPGEPCRTEEDSVAYSRLTDDFKLELRFEPPSQCEEDVVRAFVDWLSHVEITDQPGSFTSLDDFIQALRDAAPEQTSPPCSSPEFLFDSPPGSIRIPAARSCEYLREALRVWVTELRARYRPNWLGSGRICTGNLPGEETTPEPEECVLLAELTVPLVTELTGEVKVQSVSGIEINEERRPYLVHLRLLQEWLACGPSKRGGTLAGGVTNHGQLTGLGADDHLQYLTTARGDARYSPINHRHALADLSDVNAPAPGNGQVLTRQAGRWIAAPNIAPGTAAGGDLTGTYPNPAVVALRGRGISLTLPTITNQVLTWNQEANQWEPRLPPAGGGVTAHSALTGLASDDHQQYLLANGTRALTGDLSAGNNRITNLAAGTAANQAVVFQQAVKQGDVAGGDLGGTYPSPRVDGLQGRPVSNTSPLDQQGLIWNERARSWEPGELVQAPGGPYAIVAAGFFQPNGAPIGLTYGRGLTARRLASPPTDYVVIWDTYANPQDPTTSPPRMYIVKGTVQEDGDASRVPAVFQLVRFQAGGIRVRVVGTNNQAGEIPFMLEISEIRAPRRP